MCAMCRGSGFISVLHPIVGQSRPGGPQHLINTAKAQKPCPLGCKPPTTLVGREAPWPRERVRVKAGRMTDDGREPFTDYVRAEEGKAGRTEPQASLQRIRDFYGF